MADLQNSCEGCTACCKLMEVMELAKPRCVWCQHIAKDHHSCTIYEKRPEGCREWECGWLSSQRSVIPLPAEMRPDRSHVVISRGMKSVWFHCDPGQPNAWRKGKIGELLNKLVHQNKFAVYVTIGRKRIVFRKNHIPVHFYDEEPQPMKFDPEDYDAKEAVG